MIWHLSHRADKRALPLADRHYNRQHIGSPQFVPPGRCLVLLTADGGALWTTSYPFAAYVKHAWAGAWVNSLFRRESGPLASDLIRDAVAATISTWPEPPAITCRYCGDVICMVTFIDPKYVHRKRDLGRCYVKAGFKRCTGKTKAGLVVVHLAVSALPVACAALPAYIEPACEICGSPHTDSVDCEPAQRRARRARAIEESASAAL